MSEVENIMNLRSSLIHKAPSPDQMYCHHPKVVVDEGQRLLFCEKCRLWIDPLAFLSRWAAKECAAERKAKYYEERADKAAKRIAGLKKEERRVKGRLSRAKRSLLTHEEARRNGNEQGS